MFAEQGIRLLDKVLGAPKAEAYADSCMRHRHKKSSCTNCIDACPYHAISFAGHLEVDNSRCTGCGLCASVCPTGAFRTMNLPYADLQSLVLKGEKVVYGCHIGGSSGNVIVPCIGCGQCATFCPTWAPDFTVDETSARLTFTSSKCVKCNPCVDVCEPEALHLTATLSAKDVLDSQMTEVATIETNACKRCGQAFVIGGAGSLCPKCSKDERLGASMRGMLRGKGS